MWDWFIYECSCHYLCYLEQISTKILQLQDAGQQKIGAFLILEMWMFALQDGSIPWCWKLNSNWGLGVDSEFWIPRLTLLQHSSCILNVPPWKPWPGFSWYVHMSYSSLLASQVLCTITAPMMCKSVCRLLLTRECSSVLEVQLSLQLLE